MATPRILICGNALGRLHQLFKRVQSVNASSGPFDALLCVRKFFPESPDQIEEFSDYLEGRSPVPLPTYFTGDYGTGAAKFLSAAAREHVDRGFKTDGLRICDNLYSLRGSGKFFLKGTFSSVFQLACGLDLLLATALSTTQATLTDAGKSTIGGQILLLRGQVDERTIQKYEKEAKDKSRESWMGRLCTMNWKWLRG